MIKYTFINDEGIVDDFLKYLIKNKWQNIVFQITQHF